ncbi:DUF421 domain-containing protein [Metabacillus sp. GX 13764]|uniref:DUF421 domain-containing protein n=1 Tax=Metabacillus kandeliae TaxID=2900151 RepID=UPI001E347710|nr:DUF421 domain-containing protein [Metabacillus kandeliae]MCD7032952.1 DUF421 domain-containing protein [Metabacillus kandeliae]
METYLSIILRTVLLYFLIIVIFRLMGKREIGELSVLDLVVFIMIAEMAVTAIENTGEPVMHTVLPMLLLLGIQISLALISLKSQKVRHWIDGKPTIIINHGKVDDKAMKQQRYNFDDLLMQLREKDINKISDVEYAILEPSGKLSVIKKSKTKREDLQLPFIVDGIIQHENLKNLNKTEFWLRKQLKKHGHKNLRDISLCTYGNGVFYVDMKNEKEQH